MKRSDSTMRAKTCCLLLCCAACGVLWLPPLGPPGQVIDSALHLPRMPGPLSVPSTPSPPHHHHRPAPRTCLCSCLSLLHSLPLSLPFSTRFSFGTLPYSVFSLSLFICSRFFSLVVQCHTTGRGSSTLATGALTATGLTGPSNVSFRSSNLDLRLA